MSSEVIRSVHICIPFRLLREKHLSLVLENRMNLEIGIDGEVLDTYSKKDFSELVTLLRREGLSLSLHGPFHDLAPGGLDKKILEVSRERLREVFDLIPIFQPVSMVCHAGYDRKRYHESRDQWLETALETWEPLVKGLQGTATTVLFENVYERTPEMLLKLIRGLNTEKVGFCLDTGHVNVFSETRMEGWLNTLGAFLKEIHLHDNDGTWDSHWAVGAGKIDFEGLFKYIGEHGLRPIITLEAHTEQGIWQSLEALEHSALFCGILANPRL